ncbi:MAG: PAS domain S-box protein [Promethearchaeota archaeon]
MAKNTNFEVEDRFRSLFIEQKQLKKKLQEFNKRYALITENVNDFIGVLDKNLKFEYINEEFHRKHLGYLNHDLVGLDAYHLIHPDDIKRVFENYKKAIRMGEEKIELRAIHKDGHYIWLEVKGKRFVDVNNQPKTLIISRDITERKEMESKLKESEEKYRLIAETAYDLIGVLNKRFKFEYVNKNAFQKILGYTNQDIIEKSALKFIHPDDLSYIAQTLFEGFKQGFGQAELRFRHNKGYWVWIEAKGQTFYDIDGEMKALIISRDITDRKKAEERLKESEAKYRKAYNRAQFYKDLFVHDMSNILAVINSSAELISFYCGESEHSKNIKNIRNIVKKQVERGAKLVSNVNILSDLEEHKDFYERIEIDALLDNSISFIRNSFKDRNIKIRLESNGGKIQVNANQLLREVFDNILINAIKYNENLPVEILIQLNKVIVDHRSFIRIEFIDNGIGVPDERKEIIFKRGNRELKGTKGMGIGLSLVKKILKNIDGTIWVENKVKGEYSKGSNFIILIPEAIPD